MEFRTWVFTWFGLRAKELLESRARLTEKDCARGPVQTQNLTSAFRPGGYYLGFEDVIAACQVLGPVPVSSCG